MTAYWLERAWLPTGLAESVRVEVEEGVFTAILPASPPSSENRLAGLTIPGLANCHSHAFHRALRGRTQRERGTFWTWREQMYALAGRLTPETYYELALATYREMVAAGVSVVGEFHYLHHQVDGTPYDEPNLIGNLLVDAGTQAGLRVVLLDTCYLAAGIDQPPSGVQRRFSDKTVDAWAARVEGLAGGSAIHSVRAVPRAAMPVVAQRGGPLHVHVSEQVAENKQCLVAYGVTPTQLLHDLGVLDARTSLVHATHLTDIDIALIGAAGAYSCFCPTTERDLGDGIGPSRELASAGSSLTLGSDSHAVVDLFEEMRAVELDERLATQQRGHWPAVELLAAATINGHASLGSPGGRIEVGAPADLVTIDLASPRTAGTGRDEHTAVFAATTADIVSVITAGVLRDIDPGQIGADLDHAIDAAWDEAPPSSFPRRIPVTR
ncbi:MAG: formimidoylglutamate deiminase [Nocardioidaceae bacterium]